MNEMELLTRLRAEVEATVTPQTEEKVLAALRRADGSPARPSGLTALSRTAARMRDTPASWRLAIAGGLTLALTAGVLTGTTLRVGGVKPAASASAAVLLAERAAAAAQKQPVYPQGQWFFVRAKLNFKAPPIPIVVGGDPLRRAVTMTFWKTAGMSARNCGPGANPAGEHCAQGRYAYFSGGSLVTQDWSLTAIGMRIPAYADLSRLSSKPPAALIQYLVDTAGLRSITDRTYYSVAFDAIQWILINDVLQPKVTAALYRALGHIPGIVVDTHATDLAGRPGVGFTLVEDPSTHGSRPHEIILDRHSYLLMGVKNVEHTATAKITFQFAILRQVAVSGPGVRP